jgi:DNA-binding winged helix-turn-helix (wHTH) protein/tetratricopeptide (TPR) repeat protein
MSQRARHFYQFGPFSLDPVERLLLRAGVAVYLAPKAFDVLLLLIRSNGRLIEKSEFMTSAWANSFVEESNLTVTISMLRKVLDGGTQDTKYIETVAKRGYRFVGRVDEIVESAKINSLAVLPFRCLTSGSSYDYLKIGLVDAIITRLASTGQLIVRPTSAVLRYENRSVDPVTAGRDQKVDAIITGHIEISSNRIRVTVQLTRVEDGFLIWATSYDKDLHEIFALEDAVAEGVAQSTVSAYAGKNELVLPRRNTENSKAYRLYLEGRYFWNKRTKDDLRRGIECFQQAIAEDARFALAYSGLADSYVLLATHGVESALQALPVAKSAAIKAMELDDTLAEARTSRGMVYFYYEWNWEKAEQEFQRAIALNPYYIVARMWYASNLATLGRIKEALLHTRHAEELDPLSLSVHIKIGRLNYWSREYNLAVAAYLKVISLNPGHARAHTRLGMAFAAQERFVDAITEFSAAQQLAGPDPHLDGFLGYAFARSGKKKQANKILHELAKRSGRIFVPAFSRALIYIGLKEYKTALDWLEKGYEDRSAYMVFAKVDPLLDPVRSDPRFGKLLKRMKLT